MFGYKLISEDELIDLRLGKLDAELQLKSRAEYQDELSRENILCHLAELCYEDYIAQLEEALEQQTTEKKRIEQNFNDYMAAEILFR